MYTVDVKSLHTHFCHSYLQKKRSVAVTATDDGGFSCAASFLSDEKVKDYKYYLRMWAKEREPKKETIKDLPRMNQVNAVTQYVYMSRIY